MGAVADAALAEGGEVLGIIPQALLEREVGKREIAQLVVTRTMYERKERMIEASDAFVALPGGLGTLDELLEVMTLRQLGYIAAPILLLDTAGYWDAFARLLDRVVDEAFAERDARGAGRDGVRPGGGAGPGRGGGAGGLSRGPEEFDRR